MERALDRESQQKLYVQLIDIIKEKIKKGEWAINSMIPTEDELCNTFSVSKTTVRLAVSELVREGLLKRLQGKGTFVTPHVFDRGILMKIHLSAEKMHGSQISKKTLQSIKKIRTNDTLKSIFVNATEDDILFTTSEVLLDGNKKYTEEFFIPISNLHPHSKAEDIVKMSAIDFINENSSKKINRIIQTIQGTPQKKRLNLVNIETRVFCGDHTTIAFIREITEGSSLRLYYDFEKIR
ncbi:MAG: GntR family transcriptional regulator [Thermodesulfovibrionales bacterium]|nr:GntR family transcriptional regulator [Thermodesulfovibrionales bacterium]